MYVFDKKFFDDLVEIFGGDEELIIPYIIDKIKPTSIVDFGCAEGRWLMEAKRNASDIEVLGLDGPYVDKDRLFILQDEFMPVDLREKIELTKKYDLAISTEVAAHIEEECADVFVDNLVRASDHILFSSAIPGQGGPHQVNRQWQTYWVKKFRDRGYEPDFSIRNRFWNDNRINYWRRQNMIIFSRNPKEAVDSDIIDVVHPGMLESIKCTETSLWEMRASVEYMLRCPEIAKAIRKALETLVRQKRKIIIYPYGGNGRLCEMLLDCLFHYDNYLIVDNKKGGKEGKILTFDAIAEDIKMEEGVILDVCSNVSVHQEILDGIKGFASELERMTVFRI